MSDGVGRRLLVLACASTWLAISARAQQIADKPCDSSTYDTNAAQHLGAIHAVCAGKTAATCEITADLAAIDRECTTIDDKCGGADDLLNRLFECTRHRKFANYILYFDQSEGAGKFKDHRSVLMWDKRNTRYLYGVEEIYILVLSEQKFCLTAQATTIFKNEPNPLPSILKLLGKDTGMADTPTGLKAQKAPSFVWYPLSGDPTAPIMWLAIGAVPMDVNTTDWITVRFKQQVKKPDKDDKTDRTADLPEECIEDPGARVTYTTSTALAHNAFFSDNRETRGGLAVAIGATLPGRKLASSESVANPTVDGFLLGEFYLIQPTLRSDPNTAPGSRKYRSPSLAVAIGTNMGFGTASAFDELVGGLVVSHLSSNVGVIAGMSYFVVTKPADTATMTPALKKRHLRPFVGIEYSF